MLKSKFPLIILLLIIPLYFLSVDHYSLNDADESLYASISRQMIESSNWLTPQVNENPFFHKTPLVFWMSAISFKILGVSELSARLPVIILAIACIFLVYFLSLELYAKQRYAYFSCLVFLLSFQFISFGHIMMMDVPAVFFALLAVYGLVRSQRNNKWAFLYGIGMGLAVLSKGMLGLTVIICLLPYFIFSRKSDYFKNWYFWSGIILGICIFLPWYMYEIKIYGNDFIKIHFGEQIFKRSFSQMHPSGGLGFLFYPTQILVNFFPWSILFIFAFFRDLKHFTQNPQNTLLVSWIVSYFLIITLMQTKLAHYCLPLYPFMAISVGKFLGEAYEEEKFAKSFKAINKILFIFSSALILFAVYILKKPEFAVYIKYAKPALVAGSTFALLSVFYLLPVFSGQTIKKRQIWIKAFFVVTYMVILGIIVSLNTWDFNPDIKKLSNFPSDEKVYCITPADKPDVCDPARFYFWHRLKGYTNESNFDNVWNSEKDVLFLTRTDSLKKIEIKSFDIVSLSGNWLLIKGKK